jgi:hypothetical protein
MPLNLYTITGIILIGFCSFGLVLLEYLEAKDRE